MTKAQRITALIGIAITGLASATTTTIDNGSLSVTIDHDSGSIDTLLFGGSDWFNPDAGGGPARRDEQRVANFGIAFESGGALINDYFDPVVFPPDIRFHDVTATADTITLTGTGTPFLGYSLEYSLVPGANVLRSAFTVNVGVGVGTIRLFSDYDPDPGIDQGAGFETYMDRYSIATANGPRNVGAAWIDSPTGLSVVMGSSDANVEVSAGNPHGFTSAIGINHYLNNPEDADGAFIDGGLLLGLEAVLPASQSVTFTHYQAYGTDLNSAEDAFLFAANGGAAPVPEPATLTLLGLGLMGLVTRARRH